MNGPIQRHGAPYTFMRYAKPAQTHGQVQLPTEILNDGQPWMMFASIQPIRGMMVLMLPEGYRDRGGVTVYTETPMQLCDDTKGIYGDRFTWNGYLYEVTFRADWTGKRLNHLEYQAFKVEKT